ncbi:Na/Pi cotransporter family protein [Desulfatiferula olefinivorans]
MVMIRTLLLGLCVFFVLCVSALADMTETAPSFSWTMQMIGLLGGLAFFLFGMELMSHGMKTAAGSRMRHILATLTENRFRGMVLGMLITMIIQSGSATSVMLVSFVQAGLMAFTQTIGVLIGAGIGMTVTAQLIAFKVTDYALAFIALAILIRMTTKRETMKNASEILLGFGVLFYGLHLMGQSMAPLSRSPEVVDLLKGLANPWIGLAVGTGLTALIQSSTAFIGILIIMGTSGMISDLDTLIPMLLGANIGTCITAGLAGIGANRDAKRVALANVLFRVMGVALIIGWVPEFSALVRGMDRYVGSGIARQIANVHTLFNVALALLFLPFTTQYARLIMRLMPDKPVDRSLEPKTTFLDESKILSPALAIDLARAEISRMAGALERMLRAIAVPFVTRAVKRDKVHPELTLLQGVDLLEEELDFLEEKIVSYLVRVAQMGGGAQETRIAYSMISIVKDMESIGDIVHRNVIPLIEKKNELKHDFSAEGREELTIYHQKVCKQIRLLKEAFAEKNPEKAQTIMAAERKYLDLELQYRIRHLDRLVCRRIESLETHEVHMELMNLMSQIIVYSSNIAKTFMQTQVEDRPLLL